MNPLCYCLASHLNCYLTTFRNLDGPEENWPAPAPQRRIIPYDFYLKAGLAQIGFGLLTVVALVEGIASMFFLMIISPPSLILKKENLPKSYRITVKYAGSYINSAEKTIGWASNCFIKNFQELNLSTIEPERLEAHIARTREAIRQFRDRMRQQHAQLIQTEEIDIKKNRS